MSKTIAECFLAAALCTVAAFTAEATGWEALEPVWLDRGGAQAGQSPEFFWEQELRRLAKPFKPSQHRVLPKKLKNVRRGDPEEESQSDQRARIDSDELREALKHGSPAEPDSEFLDYNVGAYAFHQGDKHYQEAALAWEALLKRPAKERHYRSVWAAFMLGKLKLFAKDPEAVTWMRKTRELAKEGFADSLGLAADSYGWEAKSELEQDHLEQAAQLYLTQLALGDDTAIVSLKSFVPEYENLGDNSSRPPRPEHEDNPDEMRKFVSDIARWEGTHSPKLQRCARDPWLRRIVTAHLLATETGYDFTRTPDEPSSRCLCWLAALEKAGLGTVEDADRLGWIAYCAGNYAEAERWLKLCDGDKVLTLWLKSKLWYRAGKLKEATQAMKATMAIIPLGRHGEKFDPAMKRDASGYLGALYLAQANFVQTTTYFDEMEPDRDGNKPDLTYLYQRVLTIDEMKQRLPSPGHSKTLVSQKTDEEAASLDYAGYYELPWTLGRRLMLEKRYAEARDYLPPALRPILAKYLTALKDGGNEKLLKERRARAWFDAALIMHDNAFDLIGLEESAETARERETGLNIHTKKPLSFTVRVTPVEKERLAVTRDPSNPLDSDLAWKAALLLPDESDELADVLNVAGNWAASYTTRVNAKFYQALEHRASNTQLGKHAMAIKSFVEDSKGPWSPRTADEDREDKRFERKSRFR